ncbi:hypothetical protein AX14_003183 [Amanita brunnescens Koide BX004]|nr:hypothetical protein AX14_003183 [Amanita brunnescens Koide BX004]
MSNASNEFEWSSKSITYGHSVVTAAVSDQCQPPGCILWQLEIEKEQCLKDNEALKMTKEQHETLLCSFQSVKFEFNDLDGLLWTDSMKWELQKDAGIEVSQPSFVVLTEADLALFASE